MVIIAVFFPHSSSLYLLIVSHLDYLSGMKIQIFISIGDEPLLVLFLLDCYRCTLTRTICHRSVMRYSSDSLGSKDNIHYIHYRVETQFLTNKHDEAPLLVR